MNKFYIKDDRVYYANSALSAKIICDILNNLEDNFWKSEQKPSNFIDLKKYKCKMCNKEEAGHNGVWSQNPYLFFCSNKCRTVYREREAANNNKLDLCPFCGLNKMAYVGRADSYFCYGCGCWHDLDVIESVLDIQTNKK